MRRQCLWIITALVVVFSILLASSMIARARGYNIFDDTENNSYYCEQVCHCKYNATKNNHGIAEIDCPNTRKNKTSWPHLKPTFFSSFDTSGRLVSKVMYLSLN